MHLLYLASIFLLYTIYVFPFRQILNDLTKYRRKKEHNHQWKLLSHEHLLLLFSHSQHPIQHKVGWPILRNIEKFKLDVQNINIIWNNIILSHFMAGKNVTLIFFSTVVKTQQTTPALSLSRSPAMALNANERFFGSISCARFPTLLSYVPTSPPCFMTLS